jgi:hypothetical protein
MTPQNIRKEDIDELRTLGFGDLEILDINNMCANLNYVNRVCTGLGLKTVVAQDFDGHTVPV